MDNELVLTLWITSGVFIGGVLTPLFTEARRLNDWLAMLIGVIVGGIGNVVALIPLWIAIRFTPKSDDTRLMWERDAYSLEDAEQVLARSAAGTGLALPVPLPDMSMLAANFWPKARAEGHSHRGTYVAVFVALAVITAVEVALTVVDASWVTGPLVALSTIKVLLVAGFFMHLAYDSKWYAALFVFALPFAALILVVLALA